MSLKQLRRYLPLGIPILALAYYFLSLNLESSFQSKRLSGWEYVPGWTQDMPISELAIDNEGRMWVGDYDNKMRVYEDVSERTLAPVGSYWAVVHMGFDSQNRAWVGVDPQASYVRGWVQMYDGTKWTFFRDGDSGLIENEGIQALGIDSKDRVWVGTENGISVYDGADWIYYRDTNSPLPHNNVRAIDFDSRGGGWIGTFGSTVSMVDGEIWTTYTGEETQIFDGFILTIEVDPQDHVWVGTGEQLSVFDGVTWTGYPDQFAESIAFDRLGGTWLASPRRGLVFFNGQDWITFKNVTSGLPSDFVDSIAVDSDNRVWIASHYAPEGLSILSPWESIDIPTADLVIRNSLYAPFAQIFILAILAGIWLAVLIDIPIPMLAVAALGVIVVFLFSPNAAEPYIARIGFPVDEVIRPTVYVPLGAMLGALFGGLIRKNRKTNYQKIVLVSASIGAAAGFLIGSCLLAFANFNPM